MALRFTRLLPYTPTKTPRVSWGQRRPVSSATHRPSLPPPTHTHVRVRLHVGNCDTSAAELRDALLALQPINQVTVMGHKTGADQACEWRITFDGSSGNLDQVKVRVGPNGAPGLSGAFGDDTITASTLTDGTVDAIK